MDAFKEMQSWGHEQVLFSHEPSCGYFGIIAITAIGVTLNYALQRLERHFTAWQGVAR